MPNSTKRELFVASVLAGLSSADWNELGAKVKAHMAKDKVTGAKTDKVTGAFANLTIQVPDETPINLGGKTYYARRLQISINGFNLAKEPGENITTGDSPAAASIDVSKLDELLDVLPGGSRKERESGAVSTEALGEFMTSDADDAELAEDGPLS